MLKLHAIFFEESVGSLLITLLNFGGVDQLRKLPYVDKTHTFSKKIKMIITTTQLSNPFFRS